MAPPRIVMQSGVVGQVTQVGLAHSGPALRGNVFPGTQGSVNIQYLESSPLRIRGPVTGRDYEFSATQRMQRVDAPDAQSLLQTRFFRRG